MKEFKNGKITLLNCDCMDYLAGLKENEFDLACVDPPYGIFGTKDAGGGKKSASFNWKKAGSGGTWASKYGKKAQKWDTAPTEEYFDMLKNITREQIIWGANHFGIKTDNFVVWRKLTISESFTMGMAEFASVSCKGNPKIFAYQPQDPGRFHPTQKPVALYKWLYSKYAKPGQRILDTHLGSGSSAIAAHYAGLEFVGMELDQDYYTAAVERFKKETRQIDMFAEKEK